ncbi:unnamed protein product, partial [Adineta steineri]
MNVKFAVINDVAIYEMNQFVLTSIIPFHDQTIEVNVQTVCDTDLCNEHYFYSFLVNGQMDWLFDMRENLFQMEKLFMKELYGVSIKLFDNHSHHQRKRSVMCQEGNDVNVPVECQENICSYVKTSGFKHDHACGTQILDFTDEQMKIQYTITSIINNNPLLDYSYA